MLRLEGIDESQISRQPIDGGFLMMQMELREKLESVGDLVDPDEVLEHLVDEISDDIATLRKKFAQAYEAKEWDAAAQCCAKMQYLDKLLTEAEQLESDLMDK